MPDALRPTPLPDCPLCQPPTDPILFEDDWLRVIEVAESELPGSLRILWKAHQAEMTDLSPEERSHCMRQVCRAEGELRERYAADKINLASFGNVVPHLHWHVMARWRTDPWWPQPTWAAPQALQQTSLGEGLEIRLGSWRQLAEFARPIRQQVFIREQSVTPDEEWDVMDPAARHLVLFQSGQAVANGRLLSAGAGRGRIGRMAVIQVQRRQGLGRQVLTALLAEARRLGLEQLELHAQLPAVSFYAAAGFVPHGPIFDECRMAHQAMSLSL